MGDYNKIDGVYEVPVKGGPIYFKSRVTNRVKAAFEDWLEGQARRRVFDLRKTMSPDEFDASMSAVTTESGAGTFRWGGTAYEKAIVQLPGLVKLAALLADGVPDQKVDESRLLDLMTEAEVVKEGAGWFIVYRDGSKDGAFETEEAAKHNTSAYTIVQAVNQIRRADPNFFSPPNRAIAD